MNVSAQDVNLASDPYMAVGSTPIIAHRKMSNLQPQFNEYGKLPQPNSDLAINYAS